MILPHPKDAIHKAWLYRTLTMIADDALLASQLRFKGGTSAAMRGLLPRFSVDLDFDLLESSEQPVIRKHLESIFGKLGMEIKEYSKHAPQYFLKYPNAPGERNTLRIDISFPPPRNNEYEAVHFIEIDRFLHCHTVETMFANKLAAVLDRFETHHSIAGRDIYDIHEFLLKGYAWKEEILVERTGLEPVKFFEKLIRFIEKHITQTILDQDLNTLLPEKTFHDIRKVLKQETVMLLRDASIS